MMEFAFVVAGGGIAGVTCAETLAILKPNEKILLITESPLVKAVVNLEAVTKTLSSFDVIEQDMHSVSTKHPMIQVSHDTLTEINSKDHTLKTKQGEIVKYKYLCLCMGGRPKIIPQGVNSPYVLGLRDTDSVETLITRIGTSRRVAVVGNGGIATELVYKIQNVEIDWIVKDRHITATFVDPGASQFFQASLVENVVHETYSTRMRYEQDKKTGSGAALGPDWYNTLNIVGTKDTPKSIQIHYESEINNISYNDQNEYPVEIKLTNGEHVECDLIISATGVQPKSDIFADEALKVSADLGIEVNDHMLTSLSDVYAAGDICSPRWPLATHWFPMKLWTQARQMGCYAARCMNANFDGEEIYQDFCFELFAHSTNLFGYKVVLLGLYNGQTLGTDYECLIRSTPKVEFIKFVLQNNRLQGAILIGDTDLAETCENLILNQLDLSRYGDDILNPDIDIEDYFD